MHLAELFLHDHRDIFDRGQVCNDAWSFLIPPDAWKVRGAPVLGLPGAMNWGATLLKNNPRHV